MAVFEWVDREVFAAAAAPVAWQTLDLTQDTSTPTVETGIWGFCWAFLEVTIEAATNDVYFRSPLFPISWLPAGPNNSRGMTIGYGTLAHTDHFVVLVTTNFIGEVEWRASGATNVSVRLLGYVNCEESIDALTPPALIAGWNNIPADNAVGQNIALAEIVPTTDLGGYVNEELATRPYGDTDGSFISGGATVAQGAHRTLTPPALSAASMIALTNEEGVFQLGLSLAAASITYYCMAYVVYQQGLELPYPGNEIVYALAAPPTLGYVDLDCSPAIGAQRAVVLLKIRYSNSGGAGCAFAFRPKGKAGEWSNGALTTRPNGISSARVDLDSSALVLAITDDDGIVEWFADPVGVVSTTRIEVVAYLGVPLIELTGEQTTENTVDLTFTREPKHIDPSDPTDAMYIAAYTVTGPTTPFPERLIQSITYEGDNVIRLWFDGDLVPGETYSISIAGLQSVEDGVMLTDPTVVSFIAFDADKQAPKLEDPNNNTYDLKNPQVSKDAPSGASLGTLVVDGKGDLANETQRVYLRKRIFRRLSTSKGSMKHLPDYGLDIDDKALARPTNLRKLQADIESQVKEEDGVVTARATVGIITPGVVRVRISIKDKFGSFNIDGVLGDET